MKKTLLSTLLLILVTFSSAAAQRFPVDTLLRSPNIQQAINLVFLSDGYTASEMGKFRADVQKILDEKFNESPFREYRNFFNAFTINVPSNQSGASFDNCPTDCRDTQPFRDTYFRISFWSYGVQRMVFFDGGRAPWTGWQRYNSVIRTNFPTYDVATIITNTTSYGGTGGDVSIITLHPFVVDIYLHEAGHTFGKLSDEYWFPGGESANRTALTTNMQQLKWRNWLGSSNINSSNRVFNVGGFPLASSGEGANWLKPTTGGVCKMEALSDSQNHRPFCPVCTEGLIEKIYEALGTPIIARFPTSNEVDISTSQEFSLDLLLPTPNTLKITWTLNGSDIAAANNNPNITINAEGLRPAGQNNNLTVTVVDTNPMIRGTAQPSVPVSEIRSNFSRRSLTWDIRRTGDGVVVPSHNITWNTDGGLPLPTQTSVSQGGTITEPAVALTKDGFAFQGWFEDYDFGGGFVIPSRATFPITGVDKPRTFNALWLPIDAYTVQWDTDGGLPLPTQTLVAHGGTINEPAAMTRGDGFVLSHWFIYGSSTGLGDSDVEFGVPQPVTFPMRNVTRNMVFYANWVDPATPVRRLTNTDTRYGILLESAVVSDFARISVRTPEPAVLTVRILDNLGNTVFEDVSVGANNYSSVQERTATIVWDLTNRSGRFVANSTYLIIVEAKGVSGRTHRYSSRIGVNR